jgi:hypothetical protein
MREFSVQLNLREFITQTWDTDTLEVALRHTIDIDLLRDTMNYSRNRNLALDRQTWKIA